MILKLLDDLLIFFKDGAADDQVQAVHQNVLKDSPSIKMLIILGVVNHRRSAQLVVEQSLCLIFKIKMIILLLFEVKPHC